MTRVWIDGDATAVELDAVPLLGQGGEAEVYDLGERALKVYKGPTHPDIAGDAGREAVAAARLADAEARVTSFPRGLTDRVVAPLALARAGRKKAVVGHVMRKVAGRPLYELGEPRLRRAGGVDLAGLVAGFRELHAALASLHAAGVIVGDFNDGNVLIDGARVHLLDADSFAWGRWPCPMFTERFVDPRLCDPTGSAPALVRPHDRDSDWFAFAVMLFRCLVWVGPYGGVHQPADPARRVPPAARALRGPTVFDREVVYPRSAAPLATLPDELAGRFEAIFARGARGRFPSALLDRLRLTRCATCAVDHGRATCPSCRVSVAVPRIGGTLRIRALAGFVPGTAAIGTDPTARVWLAGAALWRRGPLGPEPLGQVVSGATRAWLGARLGAGLWRAGGYAIGFTFDPTRRGIDDRARLPAIRGRVVADGCVLGDDRAWLWWREADGARELVRVVVIGGGRVLATAGRDAGDLDWMTGLAGACAVGPGLLVPTDAGVVRIAAHGEDLAVVARFPDTAALVGAADDLAALADGLAVRKAGAPIALAGTTTRTFQLSFQNRAPNPGPSGPTPGHPGTGETP